MSASPDVLLALLQRVEAHVREAARDRREERDQMLRDLQAIRDRVLTLENQRDADAASRHELAARMQALDAMSTAIKEFDASASQTAPPLSEKERRSAAMLTWVGENWQGLAAVAALLAWLLSLFGVDLIPGDGLGAVDGDSAVDGDAFGYGDL